MPRTTAVCAARLGSKITFLFRKTLLEDESDESDEDEDEADEDEDEDVAPIFLCIPLFLPDVPAGFRIGTSRRAVVLRSSSAFCRRWLSAMIVAVSCPRANARTRQSPLLQ
jgi:hypothetical protein